MQFIAEYGLFFAKVLTLVVAILITIASILAIIIKNKGNKDRPQFEVKKLNDKYTEMKEILQSEILSKEELKAIKKEAKSAKKEKDTEKRRIFVLEFDGDIKATGVTTLREEITAILNVATPSDEVVMRLESPGGAVIGYGLAASQLQRIKQKKIPLTILIDQVAASGGYLMACVADRILAAPFAIIGSIGVLAQLPNFYRFLKKKNIDVEQLTAGEYKQTLTMFGKNSPKDREKMQAELEAIHQQFKDFIAKNRPIVDISAVATGEYWLAENALRHKLIDGLSTSDDYLCAASEKADIYQVTYSLKKTLAEKFSANVQALFYKAMRLL